MKNVGWCISILTLLLISGTACDVPQAKVQVQGPRPRPKLSDLDRRRQEWIKSMHRTSPGVDWRRIERDNCQNTLARLAEEVGPEAATFPAKVTLWQQRGASGQTGRTWVTAVAGDGSTLVIGTGDEGGGLFSGALGSNSWTQRGHLIGTGVHQMVVVPGPPETWTAIANGDTQVVVSENRGGTWDTPKGLPYFLPIARVLREPGASRTLYLLAVNGASFTIYRSDDGGLSYAPVFNGESAPVPDMWMDRVHSGPLYLLAANVLQVSSNQGRSFSPLGSLSVASTRLRLAASEAGAPYFYAVAVISDRVSRLFGSDGGKTWTAHATLDDFHGDSAPLAASISNPKIVVLGGLNTYRSTDFGYHFNPLNDYGDYYEDPAHKLHGDLRGIDWISYQGSETLFLNTDGGTYMSTDLGVTVLNVTKFGMINGEYYSTLTSKNNPDLIAAGSQDQGLQQSLPARLAVMRFNQLKGGEGDIGHLSSTAGDHNMLYATSFGYVVVLDHESPPYKIYTKDFPEDRKLPNDMPSILADPANPNTAYLTGDHLFRLSNDDGEWHWTTMPQDFSAGTQDYLTALAISHADQSYWYAASSKGRLWYSHNRGATWTESKSPSQGPAAHFFYGSVLLASPTTPKTCLVAGSGYDGGPAVYKTTDGGVNWQEMGDGLPPTLVLGLAFDDPEKQNLYAAAEAGAFVFDQPSAKWKRISDATAPIQGYWSVEGVPALQVVRFGTYGQGVWDYTPTGASPRR